MINLKNLTFTSSGQINNQIDATSLTDSGLTTEISSKDLISQTSRDLHGEPVESMHINNFIKSDISDISSSYSNELLNHLLSSDLTFSEEFLDKNSTNKEILTNVVTNIPLFTTPSVKNSISSYTNNYITLSYNSHLKSTKNPVLGPSDSRPQLKKDILFVPTVPIKILNIQKTEFTDTGWPQPRNRLNSTKLSHSLEDYVTYKYNRNKPKVKHTNKKYSKIQIYSKNKKKNRRKRSILRKRKFANNFKRLPLRGNLYPTEENQFDYDINTVRDSWRDLSSTRSYINTDDYESKYIEDKLENYMDQEMKMTPTNLKPYLKKRESRVSHWTEDSNEVPFIEGEFFMTQTF